MKAARLLLAVCCGSAVALSACSVPGASTQPTPGSNPTAAPDETATAPPFADLADALLHQLGLASTPGIELTANPTVIPMPKPAQDLSGLSDIRLTNHTPRSAWITANETVYEWTGSDWRYIGCARSPMIDELSRFGYCAAGVTLKNELPAGAQWRRDSEPLAYYIAWPTSPVEPGVYGFLLPVWDSELAAEAQAPQKAAVLVIEVTDRR